MRERKQSNVHATTWFTCTRTVLGRGTSPDRQLKTQLKQRPDGDTTRVHVLGFNALKDITILKIELSNAEVKLYQKKGSRLKDLD